MLYIKIMRIDLQLHSLYSDGYYSPAQLARLIYLRGIKAASLTDHNTIAGQAEFKRACARYNIKFIPGLELYARYKSRTFNILWYNYDANSPALSKMLNTTWMRRRRFAEKVAGRWRRLGLKFDWRRFLRAHPYYLPANHLADAVWKSPHNRKKIREGLELKRVREEDIMRYCLFPKSGPRFKDAHISLTRILKVRKEAGGQLIFCHPGLNNKTRNGFVEQAVAAGLDGIELLSPHHSHNTIMYLNSIFKKKKIIMTGGSDFHKPGDIGTKPRYSWDWFVIDSDNLSGVSKVLEKRL